MIKQSRFADNETSEADENLGVIQNGDRGKVTFGDLHHQMQATDESCIILEEKKIEAGEERSLLVSSLVVVKLCFSLKLFKFYFFILLRV